jgi:hypothetical protein
LPQRFAWTPSTFSQHFIGTTATLLRWRKSTMVTVACAALGAKRSSLTALLIQANFELRNPG